MKKRIYGIETEYGIVLVTADDKWVCGREELDRYFMRFDGLCGIQYRENGSRIYRDMAYHPEYCTAECANLLDLIAQDKAGERILTDFFSEVAKGKPEVKKFILSKNNVQYGEDDHNSFKDPVTFGCHENFMMESRLGVEDLEKVLVPFLVARQIFSGAGWTTNKIYQALRYTISQRARFIKTTVGSETHPHSNPYDPGKAILCTARFQEPLADIAKYKRLHLILGDSNMSEVCTYLKMGTVGLLLEMMEEGYSFDNWVGNLMPEDPIMALQLVSHDLTCKKPVIELKNGKFVSGLDLLWEYVHMISKYERIQGLSPEFAEVRKKLIDVLRRFERRKINPKTLMEEDSQGLDAEIDWLIKKAALENTLRSFDCHWNNFCEKTIQTEDGMVSLYDQLRDKDLKYHDISKDGLYYVRQPDLKLSELKASKIKTPRVVEEEKIIEMKTVPPQDTRAKLRGDFVKLIIKKGMEDKFRLGWDSIQCLFAEAKVPGGIIKLDDPLATENTQVAELSAWLEKYEFPQKSPPNLYSGQSGWYLSPQQWEALLRMRDGSP